MRGDLSLYKVGHVVGFVGNMGSGKTLMAVRTAAMLAVLHGMPVVSNVDIQISGLPQTRLRAFSQFPEIQDSIILFDEAGLNLDSRQFASVANVFLTQQLLLIRKRGNIMLYTVQQPRLIDVRLFENSTYLWYLEAATDPYTVMRLFKCNLTDWEPLINGRLFDRSPWYGSYNTRDTDVFLYQDVGKPASAGRVGVTVPAPREGGGGTTSRGDVPRRS